MTVSVAIFDSRITEHNVTVNVQLTVFGIELKRVERELADIGLAVLLNNQSLEGVQLVIIATIVVNERVSDV